MLGYYLRLALNSLRRTPGLTALMVCAIALGIAACIVTLTVYHAMSGNPIWWKNNVLYAVTMDSWDPGPPFDPQHPTLPPPELTYKDATYLARSDIPKRKVIMTQLLGMLNGAPGQSVPLRVMTRATTQDFFAMFDVPFEYGGGWRGSDRDALPEIVLTKQVNDELFGGADSVGRSILWNGNRFRVVGVLRNWQPLPRFYDVVDGAFAAPEDTDAVYVPFSWVTALQALPFEQHDMPRLGRGPKLPAVPQLGVYLDPDVGGAAFRRESRALSRLHGRLLGGAAQSGTIPASAQQSPDRRQSVAEGQRRRRPATAAFCCASRFAFLAVCLINTVGILLTKFIRGAPIIGLRRALGASRRQIFMQHIVEVAVVSIAGALLGLALGAVGLAGVQAIYAQDNTYGMLAHFDPLGVAWALALAAASTLAAGLYPAWSVGRVPPAGYLKSQ